MSNKLTSVNDQPAADSSPEQGHPMIGFFGIGVAINLALITAYFIWAYKQWKRKSDKHER
jgi:hypothetical protein